MMASRGMGNINPKKMPGKKTVRRKDKPQTVDMYAEGGGVNAVVLPPERSCMATAWHRWPLTT